MDPEELSKPMNEEQLEQFRRHIESKGVNLVCQFCGHNYAVDGFVNVSMILNTQPITPITWGQPPVQVRCVNCGHTAHFSVPIELPTRPRENW